MTALRLSPGSHYLRFKVRTPLQIGGAGGSALVDRPLPIDAWTGLPYLPFSALKGVFAGRLGNTLHADNSLNRPRAQLFGAPDLGGRAGRPGRIELGDGDLLSFPIRLRGGGVAEVVPLSTLRRVRALGLDGLADCPALGGDNEGLAAPEVLARLPVVVGPGARSDTQRLLAQVSDALEVSAPVVLVREESARRLWRAAVEIRVLTALAGKPGHPLKRVASGTLRRVELIPAGSQFVSLATVADQSGVDLGPGCPVQLGAWEGWGSGFVSVDELVGTAKPEDEAVVLAVESPRVVAPEPTDAKLMVLAFERWSSVPTDDRVRVRSLVRDAGMRLKKGRHRALAFWLAKAKLLKSGEPSGEVRAHRWLLRLLFGAEGESSALARRVEAVIEGRDPAPGLEGLCRWLARFSEQVSASTGGTGVA